MNGIELQDREFFAAIPEGREPNASVAQALPAMQTLGRLEQMLQGAKKYEKYVSRRSRLVFASTGFACAGAASSGVCSYYDKHAG